MHFLSREIILHVRVMMLCGSLRLERYVKVFLDLSKSRCRSSCVLSAGVEWRVYTLRYSRW